MLSVGAAGKGRVRSVVLGCVWVDRGGLPRAFQPYPLFSPQCFHTLKGAGPGQVLVGICPGTLLETVLVLVNLLIFT